MSEIFDLSQLPPPKIVEEKSADEIVNELLDKFKKFNPEYSDAVEKESEPLRKLIELFSYREMLLRQRINDAVKSVMIAYAAGDDLANLAALYGLSRNIWEAENNEAIPPKKATMETDDRLRARMQNSFEGLSTAGSRGSYKHWGAMVEGVYDISVQSPKPGEVLITVLPVLKKGVPNLKDIGALRSRVEKQLSDEKIRPLTDCIEVELAKFKTYEIEAKLYFDNDPLAEESFTRAEKAVEQYRKESYRLGAEIDRSTLIKNLYVGTVKKVVLNKPEENVEVDIFHAAYCTGIKIERGEYE